LEERRANPHYLDEGEGATGIYVAAVHTMRRIAQKTPAMGPAKVLVIGRAEALVPQAANPEAANALLKLLEEPPSDTTLILTSDVPGALLSTIRSRVQDVRVPPLGDAEVCRFLESELEMAHDDARRLAALSAGSIGRALELRGEDYDLVRRDAADLLQAALDGRLSAHLAAAHRFNAFGARGNFVRLLNETSSLLRDLLASSLGAQAAEPTTPGSLADGRRPEPGQLIKTLEAVQEARGLAERNVNPQLIVMNLLRRAGVSDDNLTARLGGQ
jgi:DNA polymerase-3 subunit delta'